MCFTEQVFRRRFLQAQSESFTGFIFGRTLYGYVKKTFIPCALLIVLKYRSCFVQLHQRRPQASALLVGCRFRVLLRYNDHDTVQAFISTAHTNHTPGEQVILAFVVLAPCPQFHSRFGRAMIMLFPFPDDYGVAVFLQVYCFPHFQVMMKTVFTFQ